MSKKKRKLDAMEAAGLRTQDQEPLQERAYEWPAGTPTPLAYVRPKPLPCPKCLKVRLDDGGRAVAVRATSGGVAYLRCKACQHLWSLPIHEF